MPRGTEAFRQTEEKKEELKRFYDQLLTGNIHQDDRSTKWFGGRQSVPPEWLVLLDSDQKIFLLSHHHHGLMLIEDVFIHQLT